MTEMSDLYDLFRDDFIRHLDENDVETLADIDDQLNTDWEDLLSARFSNDGPTWDLWKAVGSPNFLDAESPHAHMAESDDGVFSISSLVEAATRQELEDRGTKFDFLIDTLKYMFEEVVHYQYRDELWEVFDSEGWAAAWERYVELREEWPVTTPDISRDARIDYERDFAALQYDGGDLVHMTNALEDGTVLIRVFESNHEAADVVWEGRVHVASTKPEEEE